jgi:hypothetical protein
MRALVASTLLVLLAACAATLPKYTNAEAIAFCEDQARSAAGPRGEAEFGVGTGGPSASLTLSFSDTFLQGRDPDAVYTECLDTLRRNGQIVGDA